MVRDIGGPLPPDVTGEKPRPTPEQISQKVANYLVHFERMGHQDFNDSVNGRKAVLMDLLSWAEEGFDFNSEAYQSLHQEFAGWQPEDFQKVIAELRSKDADTDEILKHEQFQPRF